jgi:hypothetical protein
MREPSNSVSAASLVAESVGSSMLRVYGNVERSPVEQLLCASQGCLELQIRLSG